MIVGFNHNITYRRVSFHVQTEDSGRKSPHLVTLLYHGGTIISSQKTSYADIIKVDKLDQVIEELAKEQHKGMLRKLTKGEFNKRIIELGIPLGSAAVAQPQQSTAKEPSSVSEATLPAENLVTDPASEPVHIVSEPIVDKFHQPKAATEPSLDELIYAYLTAGQEA